MMNRELESRFNELRSTDDYLKSAYVAESRLREASYKNNALKISLLAMRLRDAGINIKIDDLIVDDSNE